LRKGNGKWEMGNVDGGGVVMVYYDMVWYGMVWYGILETLERRRGGMLMKRMKRMKRM
jgi:hypothetical protein